MNDLNFVKWISDAMIIFFVPMRRLGSRVPRGANWIRNGLRSRHRRSRQRSEGLQSRMRSVQQTFHRTTVIAPIRRSATIRAVGIQNCVGHFWNFKVFTFEFFAYVTSRKLFNGWLINLDWLTYDNTTWTNLKKMTCRFIRRDVKII